MQHMMVVCLYIDCRAEQLPGDWWSAMATAVRNVLDQCKQQGEEVEVRGLSVDTTACRY